MPKTPAAGLTEKAGLVLRSTSLKMGAYYTLD